MLDMQKIEINETVKKLNNYFKLKSFDSIHAEINPNDEDEIIIKSSYDNTEILIIKQKRVDRQGFKILTGEYHIDFKLINQIVRAHKYVKSQQE